MTALRVAPLPAAQEREAHALLDQAFSNDPTLAWYLFAERPGFNQRRQDYLALYHRFHRHGGLPILGAWQDQALCGVCYYALGDEKPDSEHLAWIGQAIIQHCGAACLARLEHLLDTFDTIIDRPGCARIEFVAVAPGQQGKGVGSALLAQVLDHCDRHGCTGIALETGEQRNLALYQRHGFNPAGEVRVDGLAQHYLYRA